MNVVPEQQRCPKCGEAITAEAPQGLCPKCLLAEVSIPTEAGRAAKSVPPSNEELAGAFPHLEILELIGQGGMGFVFKARQPKLNRFVALKILSQSLGADPAFAERFTREGQVLARLNHPNIVTIHDFGQANGFFYLLMEFVDGVNLRQAMRAGRFTPDQALAIVPKVCEALQYAHNEGILHRDIKPENILIDTKGRVKIADFGIAKLLGEAPSDAHLTGSGGTLGTPHYMAPEQIERPAAVDHRADIYSLGVVFYEMLTGELPLGRFAPPSEKSSSDPRLDDVVFRTLEKQPSRRPQSADQVKTEVETIAAAPRIETGETTPAPQQARWTRHVLRGALASCLIFLLSLAVTITLPRLLSKTYSATARIFREPETSTASASDQKEEVEQAIRSGPAKIISPAVLDQVVADLELKIRWGSGDVQLSGEEAYWQLAKSISVGRARDTHVYEITCLRESPKEAAEIANKVAAVYCARDRKAKILDQAVPAPFNRPLNGAIAPVFGIIGGVLIGLLSALKSRRQSSEPGIGKRQEAPPVISSGKPWLKWIGIVLLGLSIPFEILGAIVLFMVLQDGSWHPSPSEAVVSVASWIVPLALLVGGIIFVKASRPPGGAAFGRGGSLAARIALGSALAAIAIVTFASILLFRIRSSHLRQQTARAEQAEPTAIDREAEAVAAAEPVKTIELIGATNEIRGDANQIRTVSVRTETTLRPGESITARIQQPDGRFEESQTSFFVRRRGNGATTSSYFTWFIPASFGLAQMEEAVAQLQQTLTDRPTKLTNGRPLLTFTIDNGVGGVLHGYLVFKQEMPGPDMAKATIRTRAGSGNFLFFYNAYVPTGYSLQATFVSADPSAGEANTSISSSVHGTDYHSSWHLWRGFTYEESRAADAQLRQLMSRGSFDVSLGEPFRVFAITNKSGEVAEGYFELFGPNSVASVVTSRKALAAVAPRIDEVKPPAVVPTTDTGAVEGLKQAANGNPTAQAAVEKYRELTATNRLTEAGSPTKTNSSQSVAAADNFAARLDAAKRPLAFPQRDAALAIVAVDAAQAGRADIVKKSLENMTSFVTRDDAAVQSVRQLLKLGMQAGAIEVAKTITAFPKRDAAMAEIAR